MQWFAFVAQAISAGSRQPVNGIDIIHAQPQAVCNLLQALAISLAATSLCIEQVTGDTSKDYLTTINIFYLCQTALSAAITQGFPF